MKLEIGDIIAVSSSHGFVSEKIKDITNSPVSHVAMVIDPVERILIEANNGPVDYTSAKRYKNADVLRYELNEEEKKKIKEFAKKQLMKKYDYAGIIDQLHRYLWGAKLEPEDGKAYICSSLVNECYLAVGIDLTGETIPSPGDLYKSKKLKRLGVL